VNDLTIATEKYFLDANFKQEMVRASVATAEEAASPDEYVKNWNKLIGDLF
jgi:hypothetical protein